METVLDELSKLQVSWDGYGASAIHPQTKRNAEVALKVLSAAGVTPDLVPNTNGTISFELQTARCQFTIEIGKTRYVGVVMQWGEPRVTFSGECQDVHAVVAAMGDAVKRVRAHLGEDVWSP